MSAIAQSVAVTRRQDLREFEERPHGNLHEDFVVRVTRPTDGDEFDITDRVLSDIGTFSESTELDVFDLTHGDMDLILADEDGAISAFFADAEPGQVWELTIDWRTGRRRPYYERIFGGILDLPWSISRNRTDRTVSLQVFAYSKKLEMASAEGVKRTIQAMTGSVSAASKVVTVSPDTDDLQVGDTIVLDDSTNREEQVIASVDSSSQVTTVTAFDNAFSAGSTLECSTPYYRNKTVEFLAGAVFDAAGVPDRNIELANTTAQIPFPSLLDSTGLPAGVPVGMTPSQSVLPSGDPVGEQALRVFIGGTIYRSAGPQEGFVTNGSYTNPKADWTRQYDTTPRFVAEQPDNDPKYLAQHTPAGSVDGTHYYEWKTRTDVVDQYLDPYRDGVLHTPTLPNLDSYTGAAPYSVQSDWISIEGGGSAQIVSYRRAPASSKEALVIVDGGTAYEMETSTTGVYGQTCALPQTNRALHLPNGSTSMRVYQASPAALVQTVTVPEGLILRTIRVLDEHIIGIYETTNQTRLIMWDLDWNEVQDSILVNSKAAARDDNCATVWTVDGEKVGVLFAGNTWFVVSKQFYGTVPYADFSEMSCGEAMKELALLSMAYFQVGVDGIGLLRSRAYLGDEPVLELPEPLEEIESPLWEEYAASVTVKGESEGGTSFEITVGDTGDSAHRAELDSKLITNEGFAAAVGNLYLGFFSQHRKQAEATVAMTDQGIPHSLDLVDLGGWLFRVVQVETDVMERTHEMRLIAASE